jgi:hypothetical protein
MTMRLASSGKRDVHRLGRQLAELQRSSIHGVWSDARRKFGARTIHSIDPGALGAWLQEQVDLLVAEKERERQQAAEVFRLIEQLSDACDEPITPPDGADDSEEG